MANAPHLERRLRSQAPLSSRPERHRLRRPRVCRLRTGSISGSTSPATDGVNGDHLGTPTGHRRRLHPVCRRLRHRHGDSALELRLFCSAGRQLQSPRLLRRHQTLRPDRNEQQHGRDDAGQLRALDRSTSSRIKPTARPGSPSCRSRCRCVDKVEVIDHISKTKLVTTYKYHHGYFDGRETRVPRLRTGGSIRH